MVGCISGRSIRFGFEDVVADYNEAWGKYRRRRNRFIIVAFSILPALLLIRGISKLVHNEDALSVAGGVLILCWFFATTITSYQAQYCPCPRCGKQFSSRWWYHRGMVFARRCGHSGLP